MKLKDINRKQFAYVAGPYTATTSAETTERMRLFCKADEYLIHQLHIKTMSPLSKHMIFMFDWQASMGGDWHYWEDYSKAMLSRCDVMIVLCIPGWEESSGVTGEIDYAIKHKIPIIFVDLVFVGHTLTLKERT